MKCVLVDTSVWVDHFRRRNDALVDLLKFDMVLTHPLVLGELACGTPPNREQTLGDFDRLQQTQQASMRETMAFIESERLFGIGCGIVDMMLLASTRLSPGVELWSLDRRLCALADRFGVLHLPAVH